MTTKKQGERQPVTTAIEFFSAGELACKGSGVIKLDPIFASELPELRRDWGFALTTTSVCRTPEHNKRVGGHPSSLHLTDNPKHKTLGAAAADIAWRDWPADRKLEFARMAYERGWSVGLHDGFCHIDRRDAAGLQQAVFLYGTWTGAFKTDDVRL
jgi:zinc D-Ala-D-Ala carboxypeptidase